MKKIVRHTFDTLYFDDGSHHWVGLTFVNDHAPMVGDYYMPAQDENTPANVMRALDIETTVEPKKTRTSKKDTTA